MIWEMESKPFRRERNIDAAIKYLPAIENHVVQLYRNMLPIALLLQIWFCSDPHACSEAAYYTITGAVALQ